MVILCLVGTGRAALLGYEGFDYAAGLLDGNGGWSSGTQTVDAGSLAYPDLATSGNHENANSGQFGFTDSLVFDPMFTTAGTYYVSYLFKMDSQLGGLDGLGVPTFSDNPSTVGIQAGIQGSGGPTGKFTLEVAHTAVPGSVSVSVGDTHLAVYRIINDGTAAADQVDAIIDPNLASGEPD